QLASDASPSRREALEGDEVAGSWRSYPRARRLDQPFRRAGVAASVVRLGEGPDRLDEHVGREVVLNGGPHDRLEERARRCPPPAVEEQQRGLHHLFRAALREVADREVMLSTHDLRRRRELARLED